MGWWKSIPACEPIQAGPRAFGRQSCAEQSVVQQTLDSCTAEATLQLDATKRAHTILRMDAGAGTPDALNWLLSRGEEVVAKAYAGRRVVRLAKTVSEWVQTPTGPPARLAG